MSCEKCKETPGFILTEYADGRTGAEKCDCSVVSYQQAIKGRANIPEAYEAASLGNFNVLDSLGPNASRQYRTAMNTVRTYIKEFPTVSPSGLLFIGPTGTGKTHLAVATLRGLLDRGFEGVFFNFSKLLDHIRAGWKPDAGTMDRTAYSLAEETPILVLDDLGAHRVKDWVEDTVTEIITERCNNRLATIFTTNLPDTYSGDSSIPLDEHSQWKQSIEQYKYKRTLEEHIGSRARSRLFEMCKKIEMDGPDYRQIIATQRAGIR
ncbi:MAG TPA: ATP-binding protein [Bryobacteraceae bacterium]|jgi:DNA replication protein DnaC|nr:ATP-binding protein [Bryobacteraceae bacterium]